uniref:Polysaccharide pyruvyl transferase domain-containing protein n=1 Tax=Magnetococcus massalia (strain MO-1) TaxID=451514 RepID=A0A1S7LK90_MAGMO|nr:Protein of unknown function [Candidatus Magnetococcus massalia]
MTLRPATHCLFFPQVIYAEGADDDRMVSRRIYGLLDLEVKSRVTLLEDDLDPRQLRKQIGEMDLFIGTRMHSNIFALSEGVKTLAIAYEPKTTGIMSGLHLQRYVCAMEELDLAWLKESYLTIVRDDDYLPILEAGLQHFRQQAISDLKKNYTVRHGQSITEQ